MVPPDIPVPGKEFIDGRAAAPAQSHQRVNAIVQGIPVEKIPHVIQRIGIVEILRECAGQAAFIPHQNVGVQAEDHPLRRVGCKHGLQCGVKLTEIAVRHGQPHRAAAEDLRNLAGPVVGHHGRAQHHGIRLGLTQEAGVLIALIEGHRLPSLRQAQVKAGVRSPDHGTGGYQKHQNTGQQAAGPAPVSGHHGQLPLSEIGIDK